MPIPPTGSGRITLRYWASIRSAAGVDEEYLEVEGPVSLATVTSAARSRHSSRFAEVMDTCSLLIGERPVGGRDPEQVEVPPGASVEFLPPFAGG